MGDWGFEDLFISLERSLSPTSEARHFGSLSEFVEKVCVSRRKSPDLVSVGDGGGGGKQDSYCQQVPKHNTIYLEIFNRWLEIFISKC